MRTLHELERRATPFAKPQALYIDGDTVWMSSLATKKLYELERGTLTVKRETAIPDSLHAWGVTKVGAELRVVVGGEGGPDDVRTIRRFQPGVGFDATFSLACPEDSGSHLSWDGDRLNLSQWYPRRIVALDVEGRPGRVIASRHGICGHCYALGAFWALTTDEETHGDYWLTRIDPITADEVDLGRIAFPCRALAFDGDHFWTNHRAAGELVRLAVP